MKQYLEKISDLTSKKIINNKVTKIEIKKLRNFEENSLINFTHPLTVLVGKNGSGKSTILKLIQAYKSPNEYFIETVLETSELNNAKFSLFFNEEETIYTRHGINRWNISGRENLSIYLLHIDTKKTVGAFDKNFLYDNVGRSTKRQLKVDYLIKQSKKIKQNKSDHSQKKNLTLFNPEEIKTINFILQRSYTSISVMNHKYFNGTWGTTLLFEDNHHYSEYNSGAGELSLSMFVWKISRIPEGGVVLIDEPEIGLHPGAQKRLMEWLLQMIIKKKLQVILSSHASSIIEDLPSECIKCVSNFNGKSINIRENINYTEAFQELEVVNHRKASIIVEDSLARDIVESILAEENMSNTFFVQYTSGGASYIKKEIIPVLSKMEISSTFVLFDGDQFSGIKFDLANIPEKDITLEFLTEKLKDIVDIKHTVINWGIDGNSERKVSNQDQKRKYLINYMEYFTHRVNFIPLSIPEDVIWDYDYALNVYPELTLSLLAECKDNKENFWVLSKLMKVEVPILYKLFVSNFVKRKKNTDSYKQIIKILNDWQSKI